VNKEKPSISEQAVNLIKSTVDWAKKDKFNTVSPEVFKQRKEICLSCDKWDKTGFNGIGRCGVCGCSVGKLYIPSAKCPLDPPKWNSI
jgi:hypothetical protein